MVRFFYNAPPNKTKTNTTYNTINQHTINFYKNIFELMQRFGLGLHLKKSMVIRYFMLSKN